MCDLFHMVITDEKLCNFSSGKANKTVDRKLDSVTEFITLILTLKYRDVGKQPRFPHFFLLQSESYIKTPDRSPNLSGQGGVEEQIKPNLRLKPR